MELSTSVWGFSMSQSVVYYSHTNYDVNASFDAVKCDIWYARIFL